MYSVLIVCYFLSYLSVPTLQIGCNPEDYTWRDFKFGYIPYDAVEIAKDGKYIAQAYVDGGLLPGTIYPHLEHVATEMHKKVVVTDNIKILCVSDPDKFYWDPVDFNQTVDRQMQNTFVGGFYGGYFKLSVGRAYHDGEWKVGRVIPIEHRWKGLRIWDAEGETVKLMKFDMLKCNSTTKYSFRESMRVSAN